MTSLRSLSSKLAVTLVCAAATTGASPAIAADVTAVAPCVELAGRVQVNCPAPAAASGGCADAMLLPSAGNLSRINRATLCLVNKERTKRHLKPLRRQGALDTAAGRFAKRLVADSFFDHTAPDGSTMVDRIKKTTYLSGGLRSWAVGENIAYGTGVLGTPRSIVKAWMASSGHRANILERRFSDIGLGVSFGSPDGADGATYVHDFGSRRR